MPDLASQSIPPTPPPAPPGDTPPAPAVSPEVDPRRWEDFEVFRETFLYYFSIPEHNAALRTVGNMLYEMTLEFWHHWPDHPEGWFRGQLRAAVADLRHMQGFLATLGEHPPEDEPYEAALCRTAVLMSAEVASVAEHIERKLGTWRGEVS